MIRLFKRLAFGLLGLIVILLAPIGYIELGCRPDSQPSTYASILPPEHHRDEGRTLLTYPEWHIVHAYDDYGRVISESDPHDYRYLSSIAGFWTSLCSLSEASGAHGGFPSTFKQTIYTIGISFSAEMLAKALYEETLGRVSTVLRGPNRAPLDDLSALQAEEYAQFLQQVPWYRWDFAADKDALQTAKTDSWRDRERAFALGAEYSAKSTYAGVIAAAVANMEPDALKLRMIVTGLSADDLNSLEGVNVIAIRDQGIEVETPRYRALTNLLQDMAENGATFIEIAGNDDILLTVTSDIPTHHMALHSFQRQGYGDTRHLTLVKVQDLADLLRSLDGQQLTLEHIHDY